MIEIKNLSKTFSGTGDTVEALKNISITIADGDIYGIIGMSGAGKSTLVRCINMLERPTEGSVLIDGCDLSTLSEAELRKIRRNVTMIFQSFNLLAQRTCLKNICFPLELAGVPKAEAKTRAMELLELFRTRRTHIPHSSPAVSSRESPSQGPLRRIQRSCSATKRPARSTQIQRIPCFH